MRPVVKKGRSAIVFGSFAVIAMLGGCSLGPNYARPHSAAPETWQTEPKRAQPVWPSAAWWTGFDSPQLNGLIVQAQFANFDIAAAVERVRQADAQVRIGGAPLLPTLNSTGSLARQRAAPTPIPGGSVPSPGANASTVSLNASYEIDFWGKNRAALESARAAAIASRYDRETVALTVVASVATTYFEILALRDQIAVIQDNLNIGETVLDALRTEQRVGTGSALDVAQQSAAVASLRAQLPPLRQQLQQAIDALAVLLGNKPETVHIASGGLSDLKEPAVASGIPSELLARRPDVAEAEAQLIAANANIKVARAAYFPSVELTGNGGLASTALNSLFGSSGFVYALTTGITQPIFSGGALEGQVQLSQARYNELLQDYRKSVVSAFSDVEDALIAVQETAEQVDQQQQAVDTARRAYDISIAEMKVGTSTLLAVLTTENQLFPAEETLVQAKLAHLQAVVSLFRALGGGWQLAANAPPK